MIQEVVKFPSMDFDTGEPSGYLIISYDEERDQIQFHTQDDCIVALTVRELKFVLRQIGA